MEKDKQPKTEKVPILVIYKEGTKIKADFSDDVNDYELWAFMKKLTKKLGIILDQGMGIGGFENEEEI